MVLLTAFLIPPIRREGVMRTKLAIVAVLLLGFLGSAARADSASPPSLPNPQVNIQQPALAQPMPRPQVRRPDPPVKVVAVKKVSRPEHHHRSKRRPEKPKQLAQRPVEAKAKTALAETKAKSPPPHRPAPAKDKAGTSDATSAVQPPAQAKPPPSEHRLRQPAPAILTTREEPAVAAAPPPEPEPDVAPEQQQTATASPASPADDPDERTRWWAQEGSPAVVRFRDCIAAYAVRNIGKDNRTTWADLLIRAAESDCRQSFNDMAHTLSARLGSEAAAPVIRSLIETTLLPAARKAVSSTQRVAGGKSDPQPNVPAPKR
jgi:hypothetical protein